MKNGTANTSVWVGEDTACIKIDGRANLHASLELKDVVHLLVGKGHRRFVLDLSDCLLMDSTFLGVLARMGINSSSPASTENSQTTFELLNPNPRVRELLDTLGVADYFQLTQGKLEDFIKQMESIESDTESHNRKELAQASLEAHQTLMEINPNNVPKFKDVTKFLAEELKNLEDTGSGEKPKADS